MAHKHSMDQHLVSHEPHEIKHIAHKFGIKKKEVLAAVESAGRSREAVYSHIRENYTHAVEVSDEEATALANQEAGEESEEVA